MLWNGQKIAAAAVLGLGASGLAAARRLLERGVRVIGLDAADTPELRRRTDDLRAGGAEVRLGTTAAPDDVQLAVVSPGVRPDWPVLRALRGRGVPVAGEIELAWRLRGGRVAAVTGSNGKSTAVKFLAECLRAAGRSVALGGNYGTPYAELIAGAPADWTVLEISSFQLEDVSTFRPAVGVLLNLLPNHLDRHGTLAEYLRVKSRLFANAAAGDTCLVHAPVLADARRLSGAAGGRWLSFGADAGADVRFDAGRVLRGAQCLADLRGTYFDNEILGPAAAAVVAAVAAAGCDPAVAAAAARDFQPLPHRMELVAEHAGVRFVDDSKATNLAALAAGVRMCGGPVRLLAGGRAKEKDFGAAAGALKNKVVKAYVYGESREAMQAAWRDVVKCESCDTLRGLFFSAAREARAGEWVLLAPGCASFDQYENFEARGRHFAGLVNRFIKGERR